jgi:hypothetical protein
VLLSCTNELPPYSGTASFKWTTNPPISSLCAGLTALNFCGAEAYFLSLINDLLAPRSRRRDVER